MELTDELLDSLKIEWYHKKPPVKKDMVTLAFRQDAMRYNEITNMLTQAILQAPSNQIAMRLRKILEVLIDKVGFISSPLVHKALVDKMTVDRLRNKMKDEIINE